MWKKCLEYELCGVEAFEVAPATFDLLLAVEGNICAWESRRGNEHTGLCYLKSRLIYNHVNGGQLRFFFFFFYITKWCSENRIEADGRIAAAVACQSVLCRWSLVTFLSLYSAGTRGCLMFQRWDATHTTSPVFKFRLVVKRVSAVKQSRSTHTPLSDAERWRLSCYIRKRSTVFTILSDA